MKKLILSLLFLATLTTIFSSCHKTTIVTNTVIKYTPIYPISHIDTAKLFKTWFLHKTFIPDGVNGAKNYAGATYTEKYSTGNNYQYSCSPNVPNVINNTFTFSRDTIKFTPKYDNLNNISNPNGSFDYHVLLVSNDSLIYSIDNSDKGTKANYYEEFYFTHNH